MAVKGVADSVIQQITKVRSKADLIKQLDTDWLFQGRWLRAGRIHYIAPDGVRRVWETTERTTRTTQVDGVDIIATTSDDKNLQDKISLIAIYRAPVNKVSIEFPSGLINKGEDPQLAAVREMKEETGQEGECENLGPVVYCDPWKSNENAYLCQMTIKDTMSSDNQLCLDEDEYIEPFQLPLANLWESLQYLQTTLDVVVESKLYTFALGLHMGQKK